MADQHYLYKLKRKTFHALRYTIESKWRSRVEKACMAKAQEVCLDLTTKYEGQISEVSVCVIVCVSSECRGGLINYGRRYETFGSLAKTGRT